MDIKLELKIEKEVRCMCNDKVPASAGAGSSVNVDVTKIVKYVCIAGVLIVAIIFTTKCISSILNKNE